MSAILNSKLEQVIEAARLHGADEDPDHEVGDLQDLLRAAFSLMDDELRRQLLTHEAARNTLESGSVMDEDELNEFIGEVEAAASAKSPFASDEATVDAIAETLSGNEWNSDTCDVVAAIVRLSGRDIAEIN